ncbi:MAG: glycosyltransferase family 4 protein [Candidatus Woesearchaeota archaeon]
MVLEGEFPPDIRVENEIKILNQSGIEVVLACLDKKNANTESNKGKLFQINRKKINSLLFNLRTNNITFPLYAKWWSNFLNKIFEKQNQFDYIHAHDLPMLRVLHKIGITKHYKTIVDLHENYPYAIQSYDWATNFPNRYLVRPKCWSKIEQKLLRKAAKIIVLSENFKNYLINKYSYLKNDQIIIYPNVPDLDIYYNQNKTIISLNNKKKLPVITYFGNIAKRRGIITAFESLRILLEEGYKLKLLLIGPINKRENEIFGAYFNDPKIKDYIDYIKWIDIKDLHAYLKLSDICISPIIKNEQHESGVANKVFQYMMFGKPVIVSNCKPQAKVIQEENCGLVFESENPEDMAMKIKKLITNTDLIKAMGANAQTAILEKYNTAIMGKNLVNFYKMNT